MIIRLNLRVLALSALLLLPGTAAMAQDAVVEALGVPGPIHFVGESYALSWTSHAVPSYYKQEYLPEGQASDNYTAMFMVDAQTDHLTVEAAAKAQTDGLDERKAVDAMVNYDMIQNPQTGEIILDFLLSDSDAGIVEWNAYRYSKLGGGISMVAISRRAYGDDVEAFLGQLNEMRQENVGALAALKLPEIVPAE